MRRINKIGYAPSSELSTPVLVSKGTGEGVVLGIRGRSNLYQTFFLKLNISLDRRFSTKEETIHLDFSHTPFPLLVKNDAFVKRKASEIITNIPPCKSNDSREFVLPTKYFKQKYKIPYFYKHDSNVLHQFIYLSKKEKEIDEVVVVCCYISMINNIEYLIIECDTKTRVKIHYPENDIHFYNKEINKILPC